MDSNSVWEIFEDNGPLVVTAIHNGHNLRREVEELISLSDEERHREEDPYTGDWTRVGDTQIIVNRSRFEIDLNRSRDKAVYLNPEDAWGLRVWKKRPSKEIISRSLAEYDSFYTKMKGFFSDLKARFGPFIVLDLHTYNHRRSGPDKPPADPGKNPDVNISTRKIDRKRWTSMIDCFIEELSAFDFLGSKLDVRENIKFQGGHFVGWLNENFPGSVCPLAIEFKKFFMDEWSGNPDPLQLSAIYEALRFCSLALKEELKRL